jgi:hypothetical protein
MKEPRYMEAFHYIVGTITARERLNVHPLTSKELFQVVYDKYGVHPVDSVVKDLGLTVKEESLDY